MKNVSIREKLYLSTIADDDYELAEKYGLGLEIAEFCTAMNMDGELFPCFDGNVRIKMHHADRFVFHAPFAELTPCAIDPKIRQVSMKRYLQAIRLAEQYGIDRVVVHAGFVPRVYFQQWFVKESVKFWKEILEQIPIKTQILLENVLEPDPELLCAVMEGVNDRRMGVCLDVGHVNVSDPKWDIERWLRRCRRWLRHVHLHNNDGITDLHNAIFDGTAPVAWVLDWLKEKTPAATLTIECMSCEDSIEWLCERGDL